MQNLQKQFPETVKTDVSLANKTTFRVGGPCDFAAFPRTEAELCEIIAYAKETALPYCIVGAGSNLVFDDRGYRGLVIFTSELKAVTWGENSATAGAGVSVTQLAMESARRGLAGFSFACGIPGTVGGAVYMNAGAYGSEIAAVLVKSRCFDGENIKERTAENHDFSYRHSIYQSTKEIILSATFAFTKGDSETLVTECKNNIQKRKQSQPLEYPSAGSTFKRPQGYFAGALIEQAGLKGMRIGGAEVSEKHAGFLINRGGATCDDIKKLVAHVQNTVYQKFGVFLETEIVFMKEK